MCQASCHYAVVEADAKNVTGSVAAWNNRTSSAYSDVSDQIFLECLVRRLSYKSPSDRRLGTFGVCLRQKSRYTIREI